MLQRSNTRIWLILALLGLCWFVLSKTVITGDGAEYLLMTHALLHHGSADIRPADVAHFVNLSEAQMRGLGFPREAFLILERSMQALPRANFSGFFVNPAGDYYCIHFWLYSLLALPFYALLSALDLNPAWAFGLLNLACAGAVLAYLRRLDVGSAVRNGAMFVFSATIFYLAWSGPEVFSASCALVACLSMLRGRPGLGILLCGLGAAQNPSLIFLMPFVGAWWLLLRRWPQLGWPGSVPQAPDRRALLQAGAGVLIALMPYAFFMWTFGVPSLIAASSTATGLISLNRLHSLYFDLNQGMAVGVPGLLIALLAAAFLVRGAARGPWLTVMAALMLAVLVMTLPVLTAMNWNSGCIVTVRYNSWLAMPLLAALMLATASMPARRATALCWLLVLPQLLVMASHGAIGQRSSHIKFEPLARWVLRVAPAVYNPDPEIFFERGRGSEDFGPLDRSFLYRVDGQPVKLLRHWSNFGDTAGLCPTGQLLAGSDLHEVDRGWQYLHAPFSCHAVADVAASGLWQIDQARPASLSVLVSGWAGPEGQGSWTAGKVARLMLPVPAGRAPLRLHMLGHYFHTQRSGLSINGVDLGEFDLSNATVALPSSLRHATTLDIVLRHPGARSPASLGESADTRVLALYLQAASLDTAAR